VHLGTVPVDCSRAEPDRKQHPLRYAIDGYLLRVFMVTDLMKAFFILFILVSAWLVGGRLAAAEPFRFYESFGADFDASRFTTPIPNKNTEVRDGVLWTRGDSGGKYPPMVYLPVRGTDLSIAFRYRHLQPGGSLWFFVDGDDGFGSVDHMLRVKFRRDGIQLQVDAHTLDAEHPKRQNPARPADPVSGAYRLNEHFPLIPFDLSASEWHSVRLEFVGEKVEISLDDRRWSHTLVRPNFNAEKRKLLWMQAGGAQGIELDEIRVVELAAEK